jgi:hypothetical protein
LFLNSLHKDISFGLKKSLFVYKKERNALGAFLLNTNKVQGIVICLSWSNRIVLDCGMWIADCGMTRFFCHSVGTTCASLYTGWFTKSFSIADCGLRIADFIPHSAIRIPQSTCAECGMWIADFIPHSAIHIPQSAIYLCIWM